jgi:hypothetical protein
MTCAHIDRYRMALCLRDRPRHSGPKVRAIVALYVGHQRRNDGLRFGGEAAS